MYRIGKLPLLKRRKYKIISKKYGIPFLEVNIEASFEIICERFSERIESVKKDAKISFTNLKIMKERYEKYFKTKNKILPTFNKDNSSPKTIAKKIMLLIKKKYPI